MNASKEEAGDALEHLEFVRKKTDRLCEPNQGLNAADWKQLQVCLAALGEFLVAAERKLPSEDAYQRDRERRVKT